MQPTLQKICDLMVANGVSQLYCKFLAPNDNTKNQPYLGGDFTAINLFPFGEIVPDPMARRPNFKARLNFYWLEPNDGGIHHAPNTKLILYPKYPEVRLSGFLRGCKRRDIGKPMGTRDEGRILFMGVTTDSQILAYVTTHDTILASEMRTMKPSFEEIGVFLRIPLQVQEDQKLLKRFKEIYQKGWITSYRLDRDGKSVPCKASNCGGLTLEAELGVRPNSIAGPDYMGWEVKSFTVNDLKKTKLPSKAITLMTPEPTGGDYKDLGLKSFLLKFGYPDKRGRPDRQNFGGVHRYGQVCQATGLTMTLTGYDTAKGIITNVLGGLTLIDEKGNEAAVWHYKGLLEHWNKKHNQTIYVPTIKQNSKHLEYCYGQYVNLGKGTDFSLYLNAIISRKIYYDPGIKMEKISTNNPTSKRRSQFRIKANDLSHLYHQWQQVNLLAPL